MFSEVFLVLNLACSNLNRDWVVFVSTYNVHYNGLLLTKEVQVDYAGNRERERVDNTFSCDWMVDLWIIGRFVRGVLV